MGFFVTRLLHKVLTAALVLTVTPNVMVVLIQLIHMTG
jgi:hypothetical protein